VRKFVSPATERAGREQSGTLSGQNRTRQLRFYDSPNWCEKAVAIPEHPVQSPRPSIFMSQHPSLKGKGAIQAKRSVLKRFERVELLKKRGQFKEGQSVIGLPKTKPED
jgi:small basic protein (TIGR04137 family)